MSHDEYMDELKRLRELAVYKGDEEKIKLIDLQLGQAERQKTDEERGVGDEINSAARAVAKFASLGIINDKDLAEYRAAWTDESLDEALARNQEQDYYSQDNTNLMGAATIAGALPTALSISSIAGAGVTKLGTLARQGGAATAETAMVVYNTGDYDLGDKKDVVEVVNAAALGGAIGGGLGALTMRNAVDWSTTSSASPLRSSRSGGKTAMDEMADEELDAVTAAGKEAQLSVRRATAQAEKKKFITDLEITDEVADDLGVPRGTAYDPNVFAGLDPQLRESLELTVSGDFSYLRDKPWTNAKRQEGAKTNWRDASTAGELWDSVARGFRDFYNQQLTPTTFRLMAKVSPEVGGLFQIADQRALMGITRELREFVEPIERVLDLNKTDGKFQELLLDFAANSPSVRENEILSYVTAKLGQQDADALARYLEWSKGKSRNHLYRVTGMNVEPDKLTGGFVNYLHTKLTPEARARYGKDMEPADDLEIPDDPATKQRNRNFIINPDRLNPNPSPKGGDYQPVLLTDLRRHMNNERLAQIAEKFDLPMPERQINTNEFFQSLTKKMIDKGIEPRAAEQATEWIKENLVGQTRSPELWIQGLNSIGYFGSLAGPKSALLNLQDPFLGGVNFDVPIRELPGALTRAYRKAFNKEGFDAQQQGIDQNVGEFVNKHIDTLNAFSADGKEGQRFFADQAREITDGAMKLSQFQRLDFFSKNATLNLIHEQLVREANAGTLQKNWGFYFDAEEFSRLNNALKRHGTKLESYKGTDFDLLEDLSFAALGQQQLISGAGRPAGWSRNPNMRPMWSLRGFAMQQQGIAMKRIKDALDEGDTGKAWSYLGKYAAIAGGSFGLLNEARQWLMGDGDFELTGVIMGMADQLVSTASINTIGLNDYQWGRLMENGVTMTFLESLVPIAVDIPLGMVDDVAQTLQGDQGPLYPIAQLPLIKQPIAFGQNMNENMAQTVDMLSLGQADIRPYYNDPQEEIMRKMGLLKSMER